MLTASTSGYRPSAGVRLTALSLLVLSGLLQPLVKTHEPTLIGVSLLTTLQAPPLARVTEVFKSKGPERRKEATKKENQMEPAGTKMATDSDLQQTLSFIVC